MAIKCCTEVLNKLCAIILLCFIYKIKENALYGNNLSVHLSVCNPTSEPKSLDRFSSVHYGILPLNVVGKFLFQLY